MIADPLVYLGPSVLGNRYPDPMLKCQRTILRDGRESSRDSLSTSDGERHRNCPSRLAASIIGSPGHDQWSSDCIVRKAHVILGL
jgi:hypothetical protein